MKKLSIALAGLLASTTLAHAQSGISQSDSAWFTDAQKALQEKMARTPNTKRAKNVILLVADGNGVGTNYAIRVFGGQQKGLLGEEYVQPQEAFPYLAMAKTYNVNAQTPDSAPTASAMNTGVKSNFTTINVSENAVAGDCATRAGNELTLFSELMADAGKSVGVVSTARLTHATPAAVYAKTVHRDWEDNSKLPEGCDQKDIADQLVDAMKAGRIDFAMGGGRRHFIPKDVTDEEGKGGKRTDSRNLIEELKAAGVQYAWDQDSFKGLDLSGKPVLGLFESSHMKYEYDRTGEPSLAEMTEAAINALKNNPEGFYLEIEAGRVDHANHDGNLYRVLTDGVAFAEAIAKADEMTDDEDTLIIVTADHEHGIAFNGYCGRGTPIQGLCYKVNDNGPKHSDELNTADDGKPYPVVGYLNGPGSILKKQDDGTYAAPPRAELTQEQAADPEFLQEATLPFSSEKHSGEDVAIYAKGPWAHLVDGTVEQNYIFHVMHQAATAEQAASK